MPWRMFDSMSWIPWTEITACSIGLTISVSITSGAAPIQLAVMVSTGCVASGSWLTPS